MTEVSCLFYLSLHCLCKSILQPLKQMREWGEFYNGVAAGLRVVGADVTKVDHEWLTLCHSNDKVSMKLLEYCTLPKV